MNQIDVGFGLPLYMQEYWRILDQVSSDSTTIRLDEGMAYTFAKTHPRLEHAICDLHKTVGNAETAGYEVVIGNGASQIVSAIAFATSKMGIPQILLEPPYWARLKFLLNMGAYAAGNLDADGMGPVRKHQCLITEKYVKFAVSPNNPNGVLHEPEGELKVADMCYYWPQYTKTIEKKSHDVMIFGLSKATGHAGTRIGWALVKNPHVAHLMREYIEQATCGVSTDSQKRATQIITKAIKPGEMPKATCFEYAKDKLNQRWARFKFAAKGHFTVTNDSGMFAWCTGTPPECLKVMPASSSGMSDDSGYFRINLGCADDNFEKMIEALSGS